MSNNKPPRTTPIIVESLIYFKLGIGTRPRKLNIYFSWEQLLDVGRDKDRNSFLISWKPQSLSSALCWPQPVLSLDVSSGPVRMLQSSVHCDGVPELQPSPAPSSVWGEWTPSQRLTVGNLLRGILKFLPFMGPTKLLSALLVFILIAWALGLMTQPRLPTGRLSLLPLLISEKKTYN